MASRLVQGQEGETGGRLADPSISYPIIPAGEQTVWADVSPLIASACNDLQDGQLIHGENFSLFAAMSALEIMDPKMDAGVEKCGYYSIEEAIENNVAPVPLSLNPTLDVQRVIDVIDHLFSCEATWYKGHTLAQTVFSCIYLLRIERTSSHALLHSYCRIMRATCNAVISVVSDSRTHEPLWLQIGAFMAAYCDLCGCQLRLCDCKLRLGRELMVSVVAISLGDLLSEFVGGNCKGCDPAVGYWSSLGSCCEKDVDFVPPAFLQQVKLHRERALGDKGKKRKYAMEENLEEDLFTMAYGLPLKGEGDEKCLSILNSVEETISRQLRACKAQSLKKKQLEDIEPLQSNPDLEEGYCRALLCRLRFRKHYYLVLTSMKKPQGKGLELARKHVASCLSELTHITKSQEFLRALSYGFHQDDIQSSTTASGCRPIGFDASLNNRFSAPTPPRATHILSWKEAVSYFQKLLSDLDFVCSLNTDLVLDDVFCFIVQFQKPQPDLVARAHLQILLIQDGKLYGKEFFHDIISRELGLPELTKGKEHQKNEFIVQLGQLIINLLKILCANTAWQRRKLGKILQDWSVLSLQVHA
ncbi:hypothetical protein ZIOFF_013699 [Zingiber officinale]|uniref:Uncharacterized protein n=2 Tax=Zingiber officinale TaxID=94328 RepID=A0A8J5HGD5_ZINOF|nr:hypothetical protein ZIOFF_013699 [Zingiber officinale]